MQAEEKKTGRGGKRVGAGRKKAQLHQVRVRLGGEVYEELCAAARNLGVSAAIYARRCINDALSRERPVGVAPDGMVEPSLPSLDTLPVPPAVVLPEWYGADVAYDAAMGGRVVVTTEESEFIGLFWVVYYYPEGTEQSVTHVVASNRHHAEIIARQTALARCVEEAGGHGLLPG